MQVVIDLDREAGRIHRMNDVKRLVADNRFERGCYLMNGSRAGILRLNLPTGDI